MQSAFPSITKFGMAALLPGNSLSVKDDMEVYVDGNPTRTTKERDVVLNAEFKKSAAVRYKDILEMREEERKALLAKKRDHLYLSQCN